MIDLTSLCYFTTAFETGTFSKAARVNGVSQPTVSAAIRKLEEQLGGTLFQRLKSGLVPTPLAQRLYHDAAVSVRHLAGLGPRLIGGPEQEVRVYCAPDVLMRSIAPSLQGLRGHRSDLLFVFSDDADGSDLAFLSKGCAPESHKFCALRKEEFVLAVSRFDPLAQSHAVRVDDIKARSLIHRPYCPHADRMDVLASRVTPSAQAANDPQLLDLVAAGLGIAFVPQSHGAGRNDLVLLPLVGADAGQRVFGVSHQKTAFAAGLAQKLLAVEGLAAS